MVARRPVHDVQCHDVRWLLTALCGSVAARHVRKMFRANTRVRVPVVRGVKAGQRSCFVRAVFFHRKNESPTGTLSDGTRQNAQPVVEGERYTAPRHGTAERACTLDRSHSIAGSAVWRRASRAAMCCRRGGRAVLPRRITMWRGAGEPAAEHLRRHDRKVHARRRCPPR